MSIGAPEADAGGSRVSLHRLLALLARRSPGEAIEVEDGLRKTGCARP